MRRIRIERRVESPVDRVPECRLSAPVLSVAHAPASRHPRRPQSPAAGAKDPGPGRSGRPIPRGWRISTGPGDPRPTGRLFATAKAFNPLARDETQIFRALLGGQHMIRGFSNPDIRQILQDSPHLKDITDPRRQSAKVTRIFNRCHAHGLIAKIPHSRRWRLTRHGRVAMTASIQLRDVQFPITHMKLTA